MSAEDVANSTVVNVLNQEVGISVVNTDERIGTRSTIIGNKHRTLMAC